MVGIRIEAAQLRLTGEQSGRSGSADRVVLIGLGGLGRANLAARRAWDKIVQTR